MSQDPRLADDFVSIGRRMRELQAEKGWLAAPPEASEPPRVAQCDKVSGDFSNFTRSMDLLGKIMAHMQQARTNKPG